MAAAVESSGGEVQWIFITHDPLRAVVNQFLRSLKLKRYEIFYVAESVIKELIDESIQNKILQGSLQRTQGGATVRLYVCTKTDAQGEIDVDSSLFIEADIQLLGMSFSVNPDDPTTAEINFGVTHVTSAFGLS